MRIQHTCRVVAVLSALALASSAQLNVARADEAPAFSRRLPDNVAAHVAITDVQRLRERLPDSSWGRLLNDPQVADFRDNLADQLRAAIADRIQLPDGVAAADLLKMDVGEITVTVLKPVGGKLPIVFSIDGTRTKDTFAAIVDETISGTVKAGWTRSSVNHAGTEVSVLTRDAEAGQKSSDDVRAVFVRDGHLVASNSVDVLKQILDRWSGAVQGAFAANETLNQVQRVTMKPGREPALFWYLDPVGAATSLLSQSAASNPTAAMALSRLPKLGLTSFRGVGGTIDFATGAHDTVTRIAGVVTQPVNAAMAIVQFPATGLSVPDWVPSNIDSCMVLNWDVQAAYSGVEEMADEFLGPGGLANAIEVLSTKTDPPIHLKNDVIDGLTGQVAILQSQSGRKTGNSGSTLLAASVKDPEKFEGIIRQLIDQPGSKAGSRTVGTTTVAVFDGKDSKSTHLAVAHGELLVASDAVLLDRVITSAPGERLAESAEYQRLSTHLPESNSLISIQRPINQLEAAYEILKQGGIAVPEGIDLKLLPAFDRIRHHFLTTATWAAPTADGFQYVSFSLPPEE